MPPRSIVVCGSMIRACVPSTCTLRQSTCASASAMAASSGTTPRLKSHRRHTSPMVMSNSPSVRSQYPRATRKNGGKPRCPHLPTSPAAALSADRRLSGLKRLSNSSYRAQSASISRNAAASTSADTAHTVSNARNVTEPSRACRASSQDHDSQTSNHHAQSWGPAKQASTMVLGGEAYAGREPPHAVQSERFARTENRRTLSLRYRSRTSNANLALERRRRHHREPRHPQATRSRNAEKGAFALPQSPRTSLLRELARCQQQRHVHHAVDRQQAAHSRHVRAGRIDGREREHRQHQDHRAARSRRAHQVPARTPARTRDARAHDLRSRTQKRAQKRREAHRRQHEHAPAPGSLLLMEPTCTPLKMPLATTSKHTNDTAAAAQPHRNAAAGLPAP